MKQAAIYTRISRDAEGDGEGVERQEHLCRQLADNLGLEVVRVYTDNDIGASDQTSRKKIRVAFNSLVEDAESNLFTHIIAYSSSRLTRRMSELEILVKLAESPTNIKIHTVVSGEYNLSTAAGLTIARILAAVDAGESKTISERQQATFRRNAEQGIPKLQRQRAFGWKADGVTLDVEEATLIRDAVEKIKKGSTIAAIVREWEAAGIKTASGRSEWHWGTMQKVLLGWRTAGIRTYRREPMQDMNGEYIRGQWEQIISLEDRELALAQLEKHKRLKKRQGSWMLSGLVKCGECGGGMYGQLPSGKRNIATYACKNGHTSISAEKLENYVQAQHTFRLVDKLEAAVYESDKKRTNTPKDFPDEKRLATVTEKSKELMDAYRQDLLPASVVFAQVAELDAERETLRRNRDRFYAEQAAEQIQYETSEQIWNEIGEASILLPATIYSADGVPMEHVDEKREEKLLLMKKEIDTVIVKRGKKGQKYSKETFLARVEIMWRD